jgi:hypothetical protein
MPADVGDELSNQEDESQRTTSQVASTSTPDSTGMDVDSDDEYDTPETRAEAAAFSGMDSDVLDPLYFANTLGIKPQYIQPEQ